MEKLFDTLVVPVILYGSGVWGAVKKNRLQPMWTPTPKTCTENFGVHCKATIRTSLHLGVKLNVLKFIVHVLNFPNSLVHNIYNKVKR